MAETFDEYDVESFDDPFVGEFLPGTAPADGPTTLQTASFDEGGEVGKDLDLGKGSVPDVQNIIRGVERSLLRLGKDNAKKLEEKVRREDPELVDMMFDLGIDFPGHVGTRYDYSEKEHKYYPKIGHGFRHDVIEEMFGFGDNIVFQERDGTPYGFGFELKNRPKSLMSPEENRSNERNNDLREDIIRRLKEHLDPYLFNAPVKGRVPIHFEGHPQRYQEGNYDESILEMKRAHKSLLFNADGGYVHPRGGIALLSHGGRVKKSKSRLDSLREDPRVRWDENDKPYANPELSSTTRTLVQRKIWAAQGGAPGLTGALTKVALEAAMRFKRPMQTYRAVRDLVRTKGVGRLIGKIGEYVPKYVPSGGLQPAGAGAGFASPPVGIGALSVPPSPSAGLIALQSGKPSGEGMGEAPLEGFLKKLVKSERMEGVMGTGTTPDIRRGWDDPIPGERKSKMNFEIDEITGEPKITWEDLGPKKLSEETGFESVDEWDLSEFVEEVSQGEKIIGGGQSPRQGGAEVFRAALEGEVFDANVLNRIGVSKHGEKIGQAELIPGFAHTKFHGGFKLEDIDPNLPSSPIPEITLDLGVNFGALSDANKMFPERFGVTRINEMSVEAILKAVGHVKELSRKHGTDLHLRIDTTGLNKNLFNDVLEKIKDSRTVAEKFYRFDRVKSAEFRPIDPDDVTSSGTSEFTAYISHTGGKTLTYKGKMIPKETFGGYARGGLVTDMMENDILLGALR